MSADYSETVSSSVAVSNALWLFNKAKLIDVDPLSAARAEPGGVLMAKSTKLNTIAGNSVRILT